MLSKNKIKYIQSLGHKKRRDEENVFVAEGPKLVAELLASCKHHIKEVYALEGWIKNNPVTGVPLTEISEEELKKVSQLASPHDVVAVVEKIHRSSEPVLKGNISLALDGIRDPGNMGTIIRIADWFGVKNIFCSHDCAELYNPKVVQASMGSMARVRVEEIDLGFLLKQNDQIRSYAAVLDGRDITKMEKLNEGIIIIGNEATGINPDVLKLANVSITIPGKGKAESLNAAVAAGIILSHCVG